MKRVGRQSKLAPHSPLPTATRSKCSHRSCSSVLTAHLQSMALQSLLPLGNATWVGERGHLYTHGSPRRYTLLPSMSTLGAASTGCGGPP